VGGRLGAGAAPLAHGRGGGCAVVLDPAQLELAAVGHERVAAGRVDDPTALVPLYLRAPAIGPQKQG
jgi:hypothetical protein